MNTSSPTPAPIAAPCAAFPPPTVDGRKTPPPWLLPCARCHRHTELRTLRLAGVRVLPRGCRGVIGLASCGGAR